MIRKKDATFIEAVSVFVEAGLDKKAVEEDLKGCCKNGSMVCFKIGRDLYRVTVLYNGARRSDCNFWGHSIDNYLFDIG